MPDEGKITLKIKVKNEYDYETINIGKIISQKGKIKSSPFFGIIGSINIFQNAHAQEEFQWYGHGKNFKFYERIYSGDTIKRYYDDGWILEYKVDEYGSSIRGSYKWIKEDHKGAIENYTKTITRDPKNIYAYINRGLTRFDLKDYKGAIEDYKEALALDPGNVSVYDYRGDAYLKLENFEAAIKDYTEALARDPNYIVAYNDRGNAYLKQRNYKAAIKDYDEALARDPVNVYAYINRGVARLRDGNRQGALADYEKAAELYKQQGKTPEYQETLNKIQELKQ